MEHSEDLHRSDTMEEKLSLVNRFGLSIFYAKPNKEGFNEMGWSPRETRGHHSGGYD